MRVFIFYLLLLNCAVIASCKKDNSNQTSTQLNFNFQTDNEGWTGDFADYPQQENVESFYDFQFSHATLPRPLNTGDGAIRQSGINHSDDLFMFIKKKISGLVPNKKYTVSIELQIASNATDKSLGVGGSPGRSVYLKAGAVAVEPIKILSSDKHYVLNIDKGNQAQEGSDMNNIGDFSNGTNKEEYALKILTTSTPLNVTANANGEIWIIAGTDSGYESITTIYYNSIKVSIN